jgi:RecB family exonuclease
VARACAERLAEGAPPETIAVAARSLGGGIAEELGAALDRMGVPWRERRGRPALPAPPAQLALSLYELCERRFPRGGMEALLCSRLLWLAEEGERLPGQALARRLREAHVRDDASDGGYAARLGALASRVQVKAREKQDDCSRALADVEETRRRVQRAIDALRALPVRATLREHGRALLELLVRWGLPGRLRRLDDGEQERDAGALARASTAALARDQAALGAVEDACEALARASESLGDGARTWSRAEWAQALAAELAETSLPPRGARGGAVQLCELRELVGRRFEHVLVVGLVDGELPARPPVDPLLSDEDRRAVNRAAGRPVFRAAPEGTDLALLPPRQIEEPLLFHLGLCAAGTSISLFWPRQDGQGREVLRSPFVDEAVRALGLSRDEERACTAPLSPIPALADCRSAGEVLARGALEAFAEPAWRVAPPLPAPAAYALAASIAASPLAGRMKSVARAALAERERLRAFVREAPPGRFSGRLSGAALQAVRADLRFGPDKPLSAHQLEEHATCGFRTLAHRLLKIEVDEVGEDDLDARDRGSLLHRCLEAFFARMRDERRLPLRGQPDELATLREVAVSQMDAFAQEAHVGRAPLWEIRRAEVLQSLEALVAAEAQKPGHPVEFERRFGYPGEWEPLRIPDPEGREIVFVRGAIDRIDRADDRSLLVIDYKSSRKQSLVRKLDPGWLLRPEFQLALYVALVRQQEPRSAVDALYVSVRDADRTATLGEKSAGAGDLDTLLDMDPARRARLRADPGPPLNLADEVWTRVRAMRSGLFPVSPLSCDYCELKPACRLVALPTDPEENGGEVPRG